MLDFKRIEELLDLLDKAEEALLPFARVLIGDKQRHATPSGTKCPCDYCHAAEVIAEIQRMSR
jgi:hypothetical protein